MYTLKSTLKRGMTLSAALALVVASLASTVTPAFADSLNPLTKRSLTLSSSSPGWSYTDGSGNSTYAPPNSGANGQKTGNTFEFNVSTDTSTGSDKIKAMSFQYCTTSAGKCVSPGNDVVATPRVDDDSHSDLNVNFPSPAEVGTDDFGTVVNNGDGSIKAVPGYTNPKDATDDTGPYAAKDVAANFIVYYKSGATWVPSTGWNLATSNVEDGTVANPPESTGPTGAQNYITLWNTDGLGIPSDTTVKVVFFGTSSDYITNPGAGAFFVKINTYKNYTGGTAYDSDGPVTAVAPTLADTDVIDGGVTVANVMNQSIQITTKVLETMQFSVGTVDPDTLSSTDGGSGSALAAAGGNATHGPCDPILMHLTSTGSDNVLPLGDQNAESSLSTEHTYITHSYWRLSSNSSAGATVYYSGHTLSNTEGDQITAIGATAKTPTPGAEQFGLAIDNTNPTNVGDPYVGPVDYSQEATYENGADNGLTAVDPTVTTDLTVGGTLNPSYHAPKLAPLTPADNYKGGAGLVNKSGTDQPDTTFAFDTTSDTIPVALASESDQVVDCVTAKMRYVANIAATTPAGIYTTKINYIAAPQY